MKSRSCIWGSERGKIAIKNIHPYVRQTGRRNLIGDFWKDGSIQREAFLILLFYSWSLELFYPHLWPQLSPLQDLIYSRSLLKQRRPSSLQQTLDRRVVTREGSGISCPLRARSDTSDRLCLVCFVMREVCLCFDVFLPSAQRELALFCVCLCPVDPR